MYFGTKSYLKSNHYHTAKHAQAWWQYFPEGDGWPDCFYSC